MRKLAAVATVCALTVGCAVDGSDGETDGATPTNSMTTSSTTADSSDNPWDLPLEQRPALFDPCAEIPENALTEAGFTPEQKDPAINSHEPGSLMSCTWDNDQIAMLVVSSWKPIHAFKADPALRESGTVDLVGRRGIKMYDAPDVDRPRAIRVFYETVRGTVSVSISHRTSLSEFQGRKFVGIDEVFAETAPSIVNVVPKDAAP